MEISVVVQHDRGEGIRNGNGEGPNNRNHRP